MQIARYSFDIAPLQLFETGAATIFHILALMPLTSLYHEITLLKSIA
jgi:hypothetical protein